MEIEKILDWRITREGAQIYVKWLGFEEDQNTWEDLDHQIKYIADFIVEFAEEQGNKKFKELVAEAQKANLDKH